MAQAGQEDLMDLNNRNFQSLDDHQKMLLLLEQAVTCMKEVEPVPQKKRAEPKDGEDEHHEKSKAAAATPEKKVEKRPLEHIKVKNIELIIDRLH